MSNEDITDEEEPGLSDLIEAVIGSADGGLAGPIFAEVTTYDPTRQVCDAWPIVQIWKDGQLIQPKIIRSIPVFWPGGGTGSVCFPLADGDVVQLIVQEADVSGWIASNSKHQAPASKRRYQCYGAIPRARSIADPLPPTAYGAGTVIADNAIWLGSSAATDFVALASLVMADLALLKGELTAIVTAFNGHKHSGVTEGTKDTGGPSSSCPDAPVMLPIASAKVRSE